jgi:hypothetical protein
MLSSIHAPSLSWLSITKLTSFISIALRLYFGTEKFRKTRSHGEEKYDTGFKMRDTRYYCYPTSCIMYLFFSVPLCLRVNFSLSDGYTAKDVSFHVDLIFFISGLFSNSSSFGIPNVSLLTSR